MEQLEPCPHCARHVRISESCCPFCCARVDLADTPSHQLPTERLHRSALFSFRSLVSAGLLGATATAVSGCVQPVYGAPGTGDYGGSANVPDAGGASGLGGSPAGTGGATAGTTTGDAGEAGAGAGGEDGA